MQNKPKPSNTEPDNAEMIEDFTVLIKFTEEQLRLGHFEGDEDIDMKRWIKTMRRTIERLEKEGRP